MTERLKPCPFCGGPAEYIHDRPYENRVMCMHCGASTRSDDIGAVTVEWNGRTQEEDMIDDMQVTYVDRTDYMLPSKIDIMELREQASGKVTYWLMPKDYTKMYEITEPEFMALRMLATKLDEPPGERLTKEEVKAKLLKMLLEDPQ